VPRPRRPVVASLLRALAGASLALGCSGPLDGKRVAAEVDACRSALSETLLLADQAVAHHLVASMYVTQKQAIAGRLAEARAELERGATPPNDDLARQAERVARSLEPTLDTLDPDDAAARERLHAGLARLQQLRDRVEGAR
jgi:hypothetical protein